MAIKKYNVILAKRADIMLLLHTEFLARASSFAARRLISDFIKAKNKLAKNPFQFPFADEIDAPGITPEVYRKCLFFGRYKALFIIEDNNVFVDAIIDCRQENTDLYQ